MDEKQRIPVSGEITVAEAGRRGGAAVGRKYGREHYQIIGRKGGLALKAERGLEYYAEIGRKGGQVNRERHPHEHFRAIGKRGGQKAKELMEAGRRSEAEEEKR
jgi:hypothetical protein